MLLGWYIPATSPLLTIVLFSEKVSKFNFKVKKYYFFTESSEVSEPGGGGHFRDEADCDVQLGVVKHLLEVPGEGGVPAVFGAVSVDPVPPGSVLTLLADEECLLCCVSSFTADVTCKLWHLPSETNIPINEEDDKEGQEAIFEFEPPEHVGRATPCDWCETLDFQIWFDLIVSFFLLIQVSSQTSVGVCVCAVVQ